MSEPTGRSKPGEQNWRSSLPTGTKSSTLCSRPSEREHVLGDAVGEAVAAPRALVRERPRIADAGQHVAGDEPLREPLAEARQVGDRADRLGPEDDAVGVTRLRALAQRGGEMRGDDRARQLVVGHRGMTAVGPQQDLAVARALDDDLAELDRARREVGVDQDLVLAARAACCAARRSGRTPTARRSRTSGRGSRSAARAGCADAPAARRGRAARARACCSRRRAGSSRRARPRSRRPGPLIHASRSVHSRGISQSSTCSPVAKRWRCIGPLTRLQQLERAAVARAGEAARQREELGCEGVHRLAAGDIAGHGQRVLRAAAITPARSSARASRCCSGSAR